MIELRIDWDGVPGLRLDLRQRTLVGAAARAMATQHRRQIRRGQQGDGSPIPRSKVGNPALQRSKLLLRSIRGWASQDRRGFVAVVGATGLRGDLGASLRGRQAGLLAVQVYGRKTWHQRGRRRALMRMSPEVRAVGIAAYARALERSVSQGRTRLVHDGRR